MNQATRVLLFITFVYCYLSAVVAVNRQCYDGYCFIKPDPLTSGDVQETFSDAQQWCRNNNAVLLEITDEHVQAAVQSYYTDNVFILNPFLNAQPQQTNWTWTDGTLYNSSWGAIQTGGYADVRYAYMKFDQTNNRFIISAVTVWDTTPRAFICQYPGDQCSSGTSLTDGLCIVVNSSSQSWFGARLSCFRNGGDLTSLQDIHSSSLANKLQSGTEYWIGLTKGQWIWQDSGTQMVYSNWQPGSPGSSTCLCLSNRAGLWTDCDCGSTARPFICLQNANSTLKSSSNQTTSTSKFSNPTISSMESSNQTTSTMESLNPSVQISARSSYNSLGLILGISIGVGAPILIILVVLLVVCRSRCPPKALLDDTKKRRPTISYETTSIHPRTLDAHSGSVYRDSHAYQELHLANNNSSNHTPSVQGNENLYDTTLADPENSSQVPSPDPALDELQYQELRRNGVDHIYTTPFRSIENGNLRTG